MKFTHFATAALALVSGLTRIVAAPIQVEADVIPRSWDQLELDTRSAPELQLEVRGGNFKHGGDAAKGGDGKDPVTGIIHTTDKSQWPTQEQMTKQLVAPANGAWFWSGRKGNENGPDVFPDAQKIAKEKGGMTLEMAVLKAGFKMSPPGQAGSNWGAASEAFAKNAQGEVHVMLGESVRPQSTWNRIEFNALKANPKVTKIVAIHPMSPGKQEVLYTKK
jgi:hypothetical protein